MDVGARKLLFSGFTFWAVVIVVSAVVIWPLRQKLRFGIDLVGGTYITLEVQTEKAVEAELISIMQWTTNKLKVMKKIAPTVAVVENKNIVLTFENQQQAEETASVLRDEILTAQRGLVLETEGATVKLHFTEQRETIIQRHAVESNITVLRARLDKMSVAEITIVPHGDRQIIVELPDVADPLLAKAMIGKAAKLEFRLVDREGASPEDILYELGDSLPHDKEILPDRNEENRFYLVNKYAEVTGSQLKDARAAMGGRTGVEPVIQFTLTPEGGQKFYVLTSRNINRRLAVVLDGKIIVAANIESGIRTDGVITGQRSPQEAHELAALLKSGAFVAPVTFEADRQIGPVLGAESIRQGFMSCLIGLVLLFFFSIIVYKWCGFLAFLALLVNLLLILVGLSWLHATLTLPGIGGMVLTIGMAIDASILIYERIKEEIAMGVTVKKAVDAGFSKALRVILDANATHLISGAMLYEFGSGAIQGFAVTLMLGIVATLLTGLLFLKSLLNFVIDALKVEKLSI